ncbi:MAG: hemolysin III family protein [Xanthomonadaceae bacterium]|nr:hemolysin III family protein [Xanthomonadaceae bacterium]MDE2177609.1 hemolysin III family protein [Xanthomonadaceae bacterium]MDE2246002.1 hemolysin III family protein [Xanthomonadaceae bacterium]
MHAAPLPAAPALGRGDELAASLIHGLGIALSLAGLATLTVITAHSGPPRAVIAASVFGVSLVLLYTASTLYHSIHRPGARRALRRFDHIAIYLLIAGTYTPFTLLALHGGWRWGLFTAIWALAATGIALEFTSLGRRRWLAALVYVGMGWIGLLAFGPLHAVLAGGGVALVLAGGLAYTLGVPFYLWRRLPYHHTLWHLFVLAGSTLHFLAVLLYVLPLAVPGAA